MGTPPLPGVGGGAARGHAPNPRSPRHPPGQCDPNLQVYNVFIENLDERLPRIALFATRPIRAGEELTFDYNMHGTRPASLPPRRPPRGGPLRSGVSPPAGRRVPPPPHSPALPPPPRSSGPRGRREHPHGLQLRAGGGRPGGLPQGAGPHRVQVRGGRLPQVPLLSRENTLVEQSGGSEPCGDRGRGTAGQCGEVRHAAGARR